MMKHKSVGNRFNRSTLSLVIISYLVFIAVVVFIYRNNTVSLQELEELQQKSILGSEKMLLLSRFTELARNRARYTLKIFIEDEVFARDEINQKIENLAAAFAEVREKLDRMPFTAEDRQIYRSALDLVPEVLPAQRKAVELLMYDEDSDQARELIFDIVLPGQQKIIDKFTDLLHREQESIKQTAKLIEGSIAKKHHNNIFLYSLVFILLSMFFLITLFLIYRDHQHVRLAYEKLESMVKDRTAELSLARDEALAASRAKTEFLSSMSHELRTPLNAVIGFSQLLEISENLDQDEHESVREIHQAGNHLLTLINEILDLARIESGRLQIDMQAVDSRAIVAETESLLQSLLEKHAVSMTINFDCMMNVQADATRLKQVLLNLLSNAIKYNVPGGQVTLQVTCVNDNKAVCFSVRDTGKGIAAEHIHALFEPFNRLGQENGNIEGTGIGLTITNRIIEVMGGNLRVTSELGNGSHFWFELPVA